MSLQEQLLKAGLVNKTKASKVRKDQHKKVRQQRNTKDAVVSEAELLRRKEQAEKTARDRELNQRREEARKQREIAAQVKQLVDSNRLARSQEDDDSIFYFENKGKFKQIHVSASTHAQLTAGKIMIVNCNGVFELVPAAIAEKVRQRNPAFVIDLPKADEVATDDPYADFQVPDDLQW